MAGTATRPRCGREMNEISTDSRPAVAFPVCGRAEGHPGYPVTCLSEAAYAAQLDLQAAVRRGDAAPRRPKQAALAREGRPGMTLTEIKRRLRPGQVYTVTNHREEFPPVLVRIKRVNPTAFYVEHALGENKIYWPPARCVERYDNGSLHFRGQGEHEGEPLLTLVPVADTPREA